MCDNEITSSSEISLTTSLESSWTLWAHLPHDTDWSADSYKPICNIDCVHDAVSVTEVLSTTLVENCMLFIMRNGIVPIWEDSANRSGGCFSYKISNKTVYQCWCELSYRLYGNTISNDPDFRKAINGITISPKKNFCIIKIWMSNCKYKDHEIMNSDIFDTSTIPPIFKKHAPEY